MPVFDTPGPIEVAFDLSVGSVRLLASDRTDTVVTILASGTPTADEVAIVSYADGRLTLRSPKRWSIIGPKYTAEIDIELPTGSRVTGSTAVGTIRASGELGELSLSSSVGDVDVDQARSLVAKTSTGNVRVGRVDGIARLTGGTGSVRAEHLASGAELRNSHGPVTVGSLSGAVDFSTGTGSLEVDRFDGDLTAKTAHGGIRIRHAERGSIRIESGYGPIEIGVRAGTAVWMDVSSQRGLVRSDLQADSAPAEGEDTLEIRARTNWGDISIHRSMAR